LLFICSTHIHNRQTCIQHPYTQSIYMYIAPIYTINIHVYNTHIHNQYYTITELERNQYEVSWSRVQQYWTRQSRVQYYCTLLHETSYWSSSSVVIVVLHTALFYSNFEFFGILMKFSNILISKKQFLCNKKPYCTLVPRNFIHWFCTRVQYYTVI
jgi:hypothetical protein